MALAACPLSEAQFLCSICLDVFTCPVTIPCGHNFCKRCITMNWKISRKIQCPLCKRLFDTSLELHVNYFISEMVAQWRQWCTREASEVAERGEVLCDICTGTKPKALKSCLVCLASYCGVHLERHHRVVALKKHKLIDPLSNLEGRVCTKHDEFMDLFCKTDQTSVCQFCKETDHQSHDVLPLEVEYKEKKSELGKMDVVFQHMIQKSQLKVQEIQQVATLTHAAADKELADGVLFFDLLKQLVETGLDELLGHITEKEYMAKKRAEVFIKEMDLEICQLMKTNRDAKLLSLSDDHLYLIQNFSSLSALPPTKDWENVSLHQPAFEGTVARAVVHLRETLDNEIMKLLRAELERVQQYAVDVTLDPDTAHPKLILSDDGKQVSHSDTEKNLPSNPERFSYCVMIMGKQSFSSGKFYYEVEVKGKTKWDLGVASESANRKGKVVSCPQGGYWALQLKNRNEYVALADPDIVLPLKLQPQKVGVFVDYEDGLVSFYDVDAAEMIYSFLGCSFTDKLKPFFSPCLSDSGENSAPLRIADVQRNTLNQYVM
ncbi:zinc-binding protein A33-like [Solea solea]|uniref:zinc-binding protein A33-like n=1 Tax=Solea solea TaxID=90069 RepID=UPI00272A61F1|nr:zinc-binding protein A33-like [Solea solea]XP_058485170.1 zinc-binding protein A33-like [Solea solea]